MATRRFQFGDVVGLVDIDITFGYHFLKIAFAVRDFREHDVAVRRWVDASSIVGVRRLAKRILSPKMRQKLDKTCCHTPQLC